MCHVNLVKTMRTTMSSNHTIQEGDGFCVPELNMFWCKMCRNSRTKATGLVNMLAKAGKSFIIHSKMSPVVDMGLKAAPRGRSRYTKSNIKRQITICKCT
ncbi:hypothetical protein ATANTOWER_015530 [Ataeniobius toweri]|uniref:Uncharacterized protein n=1 Tax=Ataeniobius toweri TaxID=208326 RepID=A0ABU7BGU7_9TELE|nr:hypothetical protein [Ataeniobius toweri]